MTDDPEFSKDVFDLMNAEQCDEQNKEITRMAALQGQNLALISILYRKGILSKEDVRDYDALSDEMRGHLAELFRLESLEEQAEAGEIEQQELETARIAAMTAVQFMNSHLPTESEDEVGG